MSELYGMLPDEWTQRDLRRVKAHLESFGWGDWVCGVAEDLEADGMDPEEAREEAERRWDEIMNTF